jgi:hypothetical protein
VTERRHQDGHQRTRDYSAGTNSPTRTFRIRYEHHDLNIAVGIALNEVLGVDE